MFNKKIFIWLLLGSTAFSIDSQLGSAISGRIIKFAPAKKGDTVTYQVPGSKALILHRVTGLCSVNGFQVHVNSYQSGTAGLNTGSMLDSSITIQGGETLVVANAVGATSHPALACKITAIETDSVPLDYSVGQLWGASAKAELSFTVPAGKLLVINNSGSLGNQSDCKVNGLALNRHGTADATFVGHKVSALAFNSGEQITLGKNCDYLGLMVQQ